MTQDFNRERCLQLMPEWKDLDLRIEPLTGGITNKLFRVQTSNGSDYVFRIYGEKTELFIDRKMEMENIRLMENSGVSPKLVKYLPEENITIVEFIPGKVYQNDDFLQPENLAELVRPIRCVHDSKVNLLRLFDPYVEIIRLAEILRNAGVGYPEFDIAGILEKLQRISGKTGISHDQYVPCHNDLLADNFIKVENPDQYGEKVMLIDWEYAGMNTPYYELGDMFQEIMVPRPVEENILRIYWQDHNMDEHISLTDMFKPFPDIYWFLWSLIQLSNSKISFDYYNYGKVKYENAQKNITALKDLYGINI